MMPGPGARAAFPWRPHAHFRKALLRSTALFPVRALAEQLSSQRARNLPFGKSAALAARYRFTQPGELRRALEQFCTDFGYDEPSSVAVMEQNKVFASTLEDFWEKRRLYLAPHPARAALGHAAVDFMAAEALALLFNFDFAIGGNTVAVPLVETVMRRGAQGLFDVGQVQFEELAQVCVDLTDWLVRTKRRDLVLIEAPLGNSVPVAVMARVARAAGIHVAVVEWGCPRNDRALNGRTVKDSAADLATNPVVAASPFLLFLDDAITGSRFLKMAKALRTAVGEDRLGAVALRVRYNPQAKFKQAALRTLDRVEAWAKALAMPFGEVVLPDLPLFILDGGLPGLLETALAWGDAAHSAGKRKANYLFHFIDRFEAITSELGTPGPSDARMMLVETVWNEDTSGRQFVTPPEIAEQLFVRLVGLLPPDFFDGIRKAAKQAFPHDYYGRAGLITGETDLRLRADWIAQCIGAAAGAFMTEQEAACLNRAVNELSQNGYSGGIDTPPRDHAYGLYTLPAAPGEDVLHHSLVDLVVTNAATCSPRPWSGDQKP